MTDTNQKLREALQLIAWSNDSKWQADCARQALALPTADHFPDAAKMIETALPVGERELFERTMMDKFGWERKDFKTDGRDFYMDGHTVTACMTWQARAALSAGDAVDAQRYRYHRAVGGQSWREVSDPRNPKRITDALYDVATDAAMRKDKL